MNIRNVTTDKDQRAVLKEAVSHGWQIKHGGGRKGHPRLYHSGHVVTFAQTPSDQRGTLNLKAQIARCETSRCECLGGNPIVKTTRTKEAVMQRNVSTMTTAEAAQYLGVSVSRIGQFIRDGRLTTLEAPKRGTVTHILLDSIERYEAARKAGPVPKPKPTQSAPPPPPPVERPGEDKPAPPKVERRAKKEAAPQSPGIEVLLAKLDGYAMGKGDDTLASLLADLRKAALS